MSTRDLILDLGSHSVKLYRRDKTIEQIDILTWELLEKDISEMRFKIYFQRLLCKWKVSGDNINAIGTEAMRSNPIMELRVSKACRALGIKYHTISQNEEAEMIRHAARRVNIPEEFDIINVGGGSIQILSGKGVGKYLLPFGVSDLNKKFSLLESSGERRIDDCTSWIKLRLPRELKDFAYTGGERTYLLHFGVKLHNGYCDKEPFVRLAQSLASMKIEDLERLSPFDPKWMRGALASNCIVIACLGISRAHSFLPLDFNIAHGIIGEL